MPRSHVFQQVKDPDETRTYTINWASWLSPPGDPPTGDTLPVTSGIWAVPAPLTKLAQANTATKTSVTIAGGVADVDYEINCKVTSVQGEVGDRTVTLQVREL